ncbi:MAG: septum formation initiator family protein [Candidatus Muirbacterium halophilum]|nr:septum formation initiator family protein [Candidatus Muirbacterium halophilum]MCK9475421.1 septum formation initiator family protein [Candidatus Muirbacterium halophilum]
MNLNYSVNYKSTYSIEEQRNNSLRSKNRGLLFLKISGIIFAILSLSLIYLWQLSDISEYRTEISKLNIEKKKIAQNINDLNVIIAQLSSFDRIKKIAEEELDMVKSKEIEYVEVITVEQ